MVKRMSQQATADRRKAAGKLLAAGFTQADVARRCGVSRQTAMRWSRAFQAGGASALDPRPRGRPRRLTDEQRVALAAALLEGPAAHGWSTEIWTLKRIAIVIRRQFGETYHPGHVWKLMRALGWSLQRPTTRARERDEAAIASWKARVWPRLKKTAARKSASSSSTRAASPKAP